MTKCKSKGIKMSILRSMKIVTYGEAAVEAKENADAALTKANQRIDDNQTEITKFKEKHKEVMSSGKDLNIKW